MDCFSTLSDDQESIPAIEIKDFLEARPELKDKQGQIIRIQHGAAICQPLEDWGKEHAALESACQKLGASCTYDMRKMIDSVTGKVSGLGREPGR